jgi:hypothetical protein
MYQYVCRVSVKIEGFAVKKIRSMTSFGISDNKISDCVMKWPLFNLQFPRTNQERNIYEYPVLQDLNSYRYGVNQDNELAKAVICKAKLLLC